MENRNAQKIGDKNSPDCKLNLHITTYLETNLPSQLV